MEIFPPEFALIDLELAMAAEVFQTIALEKVYQPVPKPFFLPWSSTGDYHERVAEDCT